MNRLRYNKYWKQKKKRVNSKRNFQIVLNQK